MTQRDDNDPDYVVGYGRPPEATRFKKGRSGNPRGRPKGAKGIRASLERELGTKIMVREGGRDRSLSKAEVVAKRAVEKAMKGDTAAIKLLTALDLGVPAEVEVAKITAQAPLSAEDEAILQDYFTRKAGSVVSEVGEADQNDGA